MSDYEEAREKIALKAAEFGHRYMGLAIAKLILELTWSDGSPMIGVIAKDQSLPETEGRYGSLTNSSCKNTQADMWNEGFRRIGRER